MCQADLTPIPEVYTDLRPPGRARVQPVFQVHHTCRDWGEIQRWAKRRDALDDAVRDENAARLKGGR
jgi:Mycotoxin biosynthesis protein UstYa